MNNNTYLKIDNQIQVITAGHSSFEETQRAMIDYQFMQELTQRGYPSKEKCEEILNWLATTE